MIQFQKLYFCAKLYEYMNLDGMIISCFTLVFYRNGVKCEINSNHVYFTCSFHVIEITKAVVLDWFLC